MTVLEIARPFDGHLHLRDGPMLAAVAPWSASLFGAAIVMPNLQPPVLTLDDARAYRRRIMDALPADTGFDPRMTLYLTEDTRPEDLSPQDRRPEDRRPEDRPPQDAAPAGPVCAVKLYPAGATTNAGAGPRDPNTTLPVLERMAALGLPLCVHGESADPDIDIFDREARFIDDVLRPLRQRLPALRMVLEHVTTAEGVAFVRDTPLVDGQAPVAGTITPHHLILNRNHLLAGGLRPHYYCLPVAKRERHRQALIAAATSGDRRFFLGTDSAPHTDTAKQSPCGCAGIFNVPTALPCLAAIFEAAGALDRLEAFASRNGRLFYGLPADPARLRLHRTETARPVPGPVNTAEGQVTVFDPGFGLFWRVAG